MRTRSAFLLCAVLGSLVVLSSACVVGGPVDEPFKKMGCRFDPASISPIQWRFFSVASTTEGTFRFAQAAWTNTSAPGYFEESSGSWDPEINVTDDALDRGDVVAQMNYKCVDGYFDGNEVEIQYNTDVFGTRGPRELTIHGEHELGHAYGLDHVLGCRLMVQGEFKYTCGDMPTQDDINGVKAVYS